MKKYYILFILVLFLFISCNNRIIRPFCINSIEIIDTDRSAFFYDIWLKCVVNEKDTVIIMYDRTHTYDKLELWKMKIEKVYSVYPDRDYAWRLYHSTLYIDGKLYFPKDMEVYRVSYEEIK